MYIELHARSAFSFLEGSSVPEDLIARCAALKMPAMALLDRDGVYGAPRFHMAAVKAGIKAHIGAEVTTESCEFGNLRIDELRKRRTGPATLREFRQSGNTTIHQLSRLPLLVDSRA